MKKNITDISSFKSKLDEEESTIDDSEREVSFNRGLYYFNQQSYLLFEGNIKSFVKTSTNISGWKSTSIFSNDHNDTYPNLKSVSSSNGPPKLLIRNGRFCEDFNGSYKKQDYFNFSTINIYIVYSLDPISNTRNTDFTAQNCLFGAVKITRNRNTYNFRL